MRMIVNSSSYPKWSKTRSTGKRNFIIRYSAGYTLLATTITFAVIKIFDIDLDQKFFGLIVLVFLVYGPVWSASVWRKMESQYREASQRG